MVNVVDDQLIQAGNHLIVLHVSNCSTMGDLGNRIQKQTLVLGKYLD